MSRPSRTINEPAWRKDYLEFESTSTDDSDISPSSVQASTGGSSLLSNTLMQLRADMDSYEPSQVVDTTTFPPYKEHPDSLILIPTRNSRVDDRYTSMQQPSVQQPYVQSGSQQASQQREDYERINEERGKPLLWEEEDQHQRDKEREQHHQQLEAELRRDEERGQHKKKIEEEKKLWEEEDQRRRDNEREQHHQQLEVERRRDEERAQHKKKMEEEKKLREEEDQRRRDNEREHHQQLEVERRRDEERAQHEKKMEEEKKLREEEDQRGIDNEREQHHQQLEVKRRRDEERAQHKKKLEEEKKIWEQEDQRRRDNEREQHRQNLEAERRNREERAQHKKKLEDERRLREEQNKRQLAEEERRLREEEPAIVQSYENRQFGPSNRFFANSEALLLMNAINVMQRQQRDTEAYCRTEFQAIHKRLDKVMKVVEQALSTETPTKPECLPLRTREEIEDFENISDEIYNQCVNWLGAFGGRSLEDTTNEVVKHMMSDSVSPFITWTGREPGTIALDETKVAKALYSAVGRNREIPKPYWAPFADALIIALRNSKQRNRTSVQRAGGGQAGNHENRVGAATRGRGRREAPDSRETTRQKRRNLRDDTNSNDSRHDDLMDL